MSPITGPVWPRGFQEVQASRFQDNRHMKVVRSSAPLTGRHEVYLQLLIKRLRSKKILCQVVPKVLINQGICELVYSL